LATVLQEWIDKTWNEPAFQQVLGRQEDERRKLRRQLRSRPDEKPR
jgi:hypothetical protein